MRLPPKATIDWLWSGVRGSHKRWALQQGLYKLRLPQQSDWQAWRLARLRSEEILRQVEPNWRNGQHDRSAFKGLVKRAKIGFYEKKRLHLFLFTQDPSQNEVVRGSQQSETFLGVLHLSQVIWAAKRCGTLSYWLDQSYQGQGHMQQALPMFLNFCFDTWGLHRLQAEVLAHNHKSIALLRATGFQHEGQGRGLIKIAGTWQDHEIYAKLCTDLIHEKALHPMR